MTWSGLQTELMEQVPKKTPTSNQAPEMPLRLFVSLPRSSDLASRSTPCRRFSSNGEKFELTVNSGGMGQALGSLWRSRVIAVYRNEQPSTLPPSVRLTMTRKMPNRRLLAPGVSAVSGVELVSGALQGTEGSSVASRRLSSLRLLLS